MLVTQNGHPIRGLRAADFELRDEGVLQKIALADVDKIPLSVVLVLDSSASLAGQPMDYLRSAATGLLHALSSPDRAALVSFNEAVAIRAEPSTDSSPSLSELQALEAKGTTSLIDGVAAGLALSDPRAGRVLTVVFSDGVDTSSWLDSATVLRAAERADAVVYGVATEGVRRDLISAEIDGGDRWPCARDSRARRASDAFAAVLDEFRTRYILAYTPTNVPAAGWHKIEVRVKGRRVSVDARRGYFAGS